MRPNSPNTPSTTEPIAAETATNAEPEKKSKWTIMCYFAGDAALSASMISQLKELTDAGFQKDANVLLYFDPNCNGRSARIFDVNRERKSRSAAENKPTIIGDGNDPYVRNIDDDSEVQSLEQKAARLTLRYFLEYSRHYYRAENYLLFLMGHGVIVGNDEFLPDTDDDSSISLPMLGSILNEFRQKVALENDEFHLVAFHSCSMNSVELAFELKDSARYMMGTQGSAFPGSWPYRQLLKKIFNAITRYDGDPTLKTSAYPNQQVKDILTGLQDLSFYNARDFWHAGFSADLSMCSLDENVVQTLKGPLQVLVGALKKGLKNGAKDSILLAHWESQSYSGENYTDLFDLCNCLQKYCKEKTGVQAEISQACEQVKLVLWSDQERAKTSAEKGEYADPEGAFDRLVVFSDYYGPSFQHSNGLSIYFPWRTPTATAMEKYSQYKFTTEVGSNSWLSFLEDYFFETKRQAKGRQKEREEVTKVLANRSSARQQSVTIPDYELLKLGPPPRYKKMALAARIDALAKAMENVANTGTPSETGKETGTLAKEMATLGQRLETLGKELETLLTSGKEIGTLRKELVTLEKEMATLAKETGTLAETGKETATLAKETATLAKETATLAKETGTLAKETATLATVSKETATLSKETATLAKETATLAKEMASLGLFGNTTIKNFDAPEHPPITSRPFGNPNRSHWPVEKSRQTSAGGR